MKAAVYADLVLPVVEMPVNGKRVAWRCAAAPRGAQGAQGGACWGAAPEGPGPNLGIFWPTAQAPSSEPPTLVVPKFLSVWSKRSSYRNVTVVGIILPYTRYTRSIWNV